MHRIPKFCERKDHIYCKILKFFTVKGVGALLLVLDIGNTNTVVGVFDGETLSAHWRLSTTDRTADELGIMLSDLMRSHRMPIADIRGAIMASVVPKFEELWTEAIAHYTGVAPYVVRHDLPIGMKIELDNPEEIGADRLVNAVAASAKFGCPVIAVDLGTAITLDVVSSDGAYIGGAIAPGLAVSAENLFRRTAKLPQIPLVAPETVIGKNTRHAIQSGIVYGFAGLVDQLVERIFAELGTRTHVVATGGHAGIIATHARTVTAVEPWLMLDGLLIIYERLSR